MSAPSDSWTFPGCPSPPDYALDWDSLCAQFAWLRALAGVPQDARHHAEGDVLTHTRLVAEALVGLADWRALDATARAVLFLAALLHDVAKPLCTEVDARGRISSPRHARKGEHLARSLLWRTAADYAHIPFAAREQVARLVRFHGLPLWFLDSASYERRIIAASQSARLEWVALLAEADVRGRVCADQRDLLDRVALFRQACAELECYAHPRRFANDHSRFLFFRSAQRSMDYAAYDDTAFEVVLLCGLPATGKDTWVRDHAPGWPVIALDQIRAELAVLPTAHQGAVAGAAKRRARALLQARQPFVWNATNLTHLLRAQLVDFFTAYHARVRLVYLDAPYPLLMQRNAARAASVPRKVIDRMLDNIEPPTLMEAHAVAWVYAGVTLTAPYT